MPYFYRHPRPSTTGTIATLFFALLLFIAAITLLGMLVWSFFFIGQREPGMIGGFAFMLAAGIGAYALARMVYVDWRNHLQERKNRFSDT